MILDFLITPYALLALPILYYLLPYLRNWSIRDIPAPFPAAFTNLWLLYQCRRGRRYLAVHEAHEKLGPLVRIQPNHVSVADDKAIPVIYGHGTGFLKSEYYDAFVSIQRGLFNTRDRSEHTRKRKVVSHTFSAKSIGQFEQYMHHNLDELVKQWDRMAEKAGGGWAEFDVLHWFNYLAFDIIGDLAFGAPFGMLEKGKDFAEVRMSPDAPPTFAPAIEVLNRRGEVSGTLGVLPQLKPYAKYLPDPFFRKGVEAVQNLAGIATARVKQRLDNADKIDRVDLLARLMEGRDEKGEKLGRSELTAEALTQLIAGSDTTSNTSCALLYHVIKHPEVVKKLQKEIDQAIPNVDGAPNYEQVKNLPYMEAVIAETMRIHSTSSLGLPRVVPPGPGVNIHNHHFSQGTVLSVPAYTMHHSTEIWGKDADEFRPERFLPGNLTERQKGAFIPFSYGPRACVGRNVAEMELALIVATVFHRYEFDLRQNELETREGFLRKPLGCIVGMKRRKLYVLRRAALRTLLSSSTPFLSRARCISTYTPLTFRENAQCTLASFQRRFASDSARPSEASATDETIPVDYSESEQRTIDEHGSGSSAPVHTEATSAPQPGTPEAAAAPQEGDRYGQSTIRSAVGAAGESISNAASATAAALGLGGSSEPRQRRSNNRNEPGTALYVGNLFFDVSEDALRKEFGRFGAIKSVKIIYDSRGLSKGFGYVDFEDVDSATAAMENLDQKVFEGRRMTVQFTERKEANRQSRTFAASGQPSKTLFIGNMSFEMSDKDLNDLFREIRNVLDVRVAIDRRSGQPRGFAHADFIDIPSAQKAMEVLKDKEIYGRRLRVDFSQSSSQSKPR